MKASTVLALALPAVVLAQTTATPPDLSVCENEAGSYSRYCPRCEHRCADERDDAERYRACLYSTFFGINYEDSQCQQHGGNDCANKAVDSVCGTQ